jgi:hypothetical protein
MTTIATATARCCRWPPADADPDDFLDDPAAWPVCGKRTVAPGASYCLRHLLAGPRPL